MTTSAILGGSGAPKTGMEADRPVLGRHAAKLGITLITITQRAALLKYHSVELRLIDGEGDWQLRTIKPEDS